MQDIRSPLCFWSLLTIFIVKPLHCAKLRFGKISRHLRVHIISYHGHNLCDALSARPNSTSPAFPSPLRSEDFASSWFRKSSRLPRLPPFVFKTCFNFQSEYKWQMEGIPDNYAKYEWDSDRRHCNQKITQSGARWYAKSPNAAESLKDLEFAARFQSSENQRSVVQCIMISQEQAKGIESTTENYVDLAIVRQLVPVDGWTMAAAAPKAIIRCPGLCCKLFCQIDICWCS